MSPLSRIRARLTYWSWKNAVLDGDSERKRRALEQAVAQADVRMASVILNYLLLIRNAVPNADEYVSQLLRNIGKHDSSQLLRLLAHTMSTYEGDFGARTRALVLGQAIVEFREREWDLAALLQTAREAAVRLAAVRALRSQSALVAPALMLGVADADEEVQLECIAALAELDLPPDEEIQARATLSSRLHSPRHPLRRAVAEAIEKAEWLPRLEPERGLWYLSLDDWATVKQSRALRALEIALNFDDETALRAAKLLREIGEAASVCPVMNALISHVALAQTLEDVLREILTRHLKEIDATDLRAIVALHDIKTGEEIDLGRFHTWNLDLQPLHDLAHQELERRCAENIGGNEAIESALSAEPDA